MELSKEKASKTKLTEKYTEVLDTYNADNPGTKLNMDQKDISIPTSLMNKALGIFYNATLDKLAGEARKGGGGGKKRYCQRTTHAGRHP